MDGNRSTYFLQADEIDHLTIRYTDFGEKLNKKKATEMIHFYNDIYSAVSEKLKAYELSFEALDRYSEKELYDILVIIRTVLLELARI